MQIAARCLCSLTAFALVACGHEAQVGSSALSDATAEGTASPGAQPANAGVQDAAAKRGVPRAALDFEAQAEGAYDAALKGDFAGVQTAASSLRDLWKRLRKTLMRDGLRNAIVRDLDASVEHLWSLSAASADRIQLARAANAVSGPMNDVFDLYRPRVPSALLSLDFLGREIVLDCRESSDHLATVHLKELKAEWTRLRPRALKAGGTAEATKLDATLSAATGALSSRDWANLERHAQAELEIVDALEHNLRW
jgi:hypothetical protein